MQLIVNEIYNALVGMLIFYICDTTKSSQQSYEIDTIIINILQMRKLGSETVNTKISLQQVVASS